MPRIIGILADSHGHPEKLRQGIEELEARRVDTLMHLGDMTDTLRPETVDECVAILIRNRVTGVMGNHEYSLATHHFKRYPGRFSESTKAYVSALPHQLNVCDVCFTHFSPDGGVHGLYAPTDANSYKATLRNSRSPVLVNGHSHEPRAYRQLDGMIEAMTIEVGKPFELEETARYVLTCGALEDSYCAVLDLQARSFEVILLRR